MSLENKAAAYGFFPAESQLENVFRALNHAGFENTNLCLLLTAGHPIAERVRHCTVQPLPLDLTDSAEPDRILACLSRYGAVLISDMGLFIGSSDFLHVMAMPENLLRSDNVSEVFGLFGIAPDEAARYRSRLRGNAAFILVSCDHVAHSEWARELLNTMGAEDASLLRVTSPEEQEPETRPPTIN